MPVIDSFFSAATALSQMNKRGFSLFMSAFRILNCFLIKLIASSDNAAYSFVIVEPFPICEPSPEALATWFLNVDPIFDISMLGPPLNFKALSIFIFYLYVSVVIFFF